MDWTNYTTSANPSDAKPLTIESLREAMEYLNRHYPPPPKPDPKKCAQCGEEMSKPAMDITAGVEVFSPVVAHLCGRCACVAKRQFYYQPRNETFRAVSRHR